MNQMNKLFENPVFSITLTLAVFYLARRLYNRHRWFLFQPVLITIITIIVVLLLLDVPYETYKIGADYISFFLGPSVVSLGVLLYEKSALIKKHYKPILIAILAGSITGLISVVAICLIMQAPHEILVSLAPKSVSTPIAIEISTLTGGIPSLTTAVVIMVGIFGAALGVNILRLFGIKSPMATGLALGAACHGIGTSKALEISPLAGAASALAMCINGIITAILTPWVLSLIQWL